MVQVDMVANSKTYARMTETPVRRRPYNVTTHSGWVLTTEERLHGSDFSGGQHSPDPFIVRFVLSVSLRLRP